MASNNSSVVQSFSIALIVFVMLTFVLAVTTYLFFKQANEAQDKLAKAQTETSDANTKRLQAEKNRLELVKEVLGFPEELGNPEILKRKQDAIDDVYGKYLEQPTYDGVVEWLSSSVQKHHEEMSRLQAEKDDFAAENKKLAAQHKSELDKKEESTKEAFSKIKDVESNQQESAAAAAAVIKQLEQARDAATAQTKRLKLVGEKISEARPYLSLDRQQKWPADSEAADGDRDERRVAVLLDEMRDRERTIVRLNQIIAQLRVADPALQTTVLAATPKDDRVDGFDGRILSVNELDRTVLVSVGRTTGLRAGLQLNVYDPTDPQPQIGSKKAVVEVVAIESDSLVRCRVRKDSTRDPIIPGDVVATSLWSPGTPLEVVIVGITQFGGEPEADRKRLEQLVERVGGTVADTVSPSTTMVVDAGVPQSKGIDAEGQVASRKFWSAKQKERRVSQMKAAEQMGIKVTAIEPFLDMLGLQVESVRANRLPVPLDRNAAPARTENVAF
jgi:type II secretory pathway pseudopilin PulG